MATIVSFGIVLRFKLVVKDRVFDYIVLINLTFLPVFLPTALCICPARILSYLPIYARCQNS